MRVYVPCFVQQKVQNVLPLYIDYIANYIFIYLLYQYQYMPNENQSKNVYIYTRITQREKDRILGLVKHGSYMTLSDFVRQAVREKLGEN